MRILLAQINSTIGDIYGNQAKILSAIVHGKKMGARIVLFPELALSGYHPEDFLLLPHFITDIRAALEPIIVASQGIAAIVGLPRANPVKGEKPVCNSAAIIDNGVLLGFQDKMLLPTYDVFDERRFFEPARSTNLWHIGDISVGVTICEDIWQHSNLLKYTSYRRDPVKELAHHKPDLLLNLSASPFSVSKFSNRLNVCKKAAKALNAPLLLCNQVGSNDSLIFDGYSLYLDAEGSLLSCGKGFQEDLMLVDLSLNLPEMKLTIDPLKDLHSALVLGVRDYFHKSSFTKACLGLSGGVDSALVACIGVEALGKENVLGIMMPSRFSSPDSIADALQLASALGIETKEISIEGPFTSYLELLAPVFAGRPFDVAEENIQARIRGMILMAISNKFGSIVLSTGNKSEIAMGYSTLYGDTCGGLAVINDVTKQDVFALSRWINRYQEIIPWRTISKPPSAELRPDQKDSDSLPEYEIIDNVLQAYVEGQRSPQEIAAQFAYPQDLVDDLIGRIHRNEYKRRQSPPGLRVSEKAFSTGRRFPIVQRYVL